MTVTLSVLGVCLVAGVIAVVRKRARREADNLRRATAWAEAIPEAPIGTPDYCRQRGVF